MWGWIDLESASWTVSGDPHEFPLPASKNRRLFGWRFDQASQTMKEMSPRPDGSLWSASLESWLVPDGTILRLYDRAGQVRLTGMEAEAERADAQTRRAQMLAEKMRSLGIDPDQLI